MGRRGRTLALLGLSLVACSSGNSGTPSREAGPESSDASVVDAVAPSPDGGAVAMQTIGTAGGVVSVPGAVLTIPPGALANDTMITVTMSSAAVPGGYVDYSPVFSFGPAGTTLMQPATIAITLTTPATDATIFWSNASGGYDPLPTQITTDSASASITRLADGFAGKVQTATAGEDAATDAAAADDAAPLEASTLADGALIDAAPTDGAPADAAGDAAPADAAPADASTPGIFATVDGTPTAFVYNAKVSQLQGWWSLSGDDSPSLTHWTIQLYVPPSAGIQTCSTSVFFPQIQYNHSTAVSADAGTIDTRFTTVGTTGASCTIDETTTATVQGQYAQGTFSGTLVLTGDAGATHTLTSGSYDLIVP